MAKKFDPEATIAEIVSLKNQIAGLEMLMDSKKKMMATYFDQSGERNVANDEATVFVQERVTVEYDIPAILKKLPKDLSAQFITRKYEVSDWAKFVALMKAHGIKPDQIRQFFTVKKEVDQAKLSTLYDHGKLTVKDLQGCYTSTVKKSIVLKMKNTDGQIPITLPPEDGKKALKNGRKK